MRILNPFVIYYVDNFHCMLEASNFASGTYMPYVKRTVVTANASTTYGNKSSLTCPSLSQYVPTWPNLS
jgi:hypothetical protein